MSSKKEGLPATISDAKLNELRGVVSDLRLLATGNIEQFLLSKENADRARIKGDIPDDFELSEADKISLTEKVVVLSSEKLKEIDDFFMPFSYDPTRVQSAQIKERGGKNPKWIVQLMDIVQGERLKRHDIRNF